MKNNKKRSTIKKDNAGQIIHINGMPKRLDCWGYNVHNCFTGAECILACSREYHTKIPFADFGKALRLIVNSETDNVKIGKSMVKLIDEWFK